MFFFDVFVRYKQQNSSEIYSLNFSVVKKSVLNVDELTLSVLCAIDPLNVSQSDVCMRHIPCSLWGARSTYMTIQNVSSEFYPIMPIIQSISVAFGCLIKWHSDTIWV
jgi:hypothetical protein